MSPSSRELIHRVQELLVNSDKQYQFIETVNLFIDHPMSQSQKDNDTNHNWSPSQLTQSSSSSQSSQPSQTTKTDLSTKTLLCGSKPQKHVLKLHTKNGSSLITTSFKRHSCFKEWISTYKTTGKYEEPAPDQIRDCHASLQEEAVELC